MSNKRNGGIEYILNLAARLIEAARAANDADDIDKEGAATREAAEFLTQLLSQVDNSGSNPDLDGLTDNIDGPIERLNRAFAAGYGAAAARVVVSGSSGGNIIVHGFVLPPLMPNNQRVVLLDRCAHLSVVGGHVASGLPVHWLHRRYDAASDVQLPITLDDVKAALDAKPDIGAIGVTSPTYDGFDIDLEGISALCRRRGVLLVVDAAWGPGYGLLSHIGFPPSPIVRGADIAVVSTHKKGFAPSQIAVVLFRDPRHAAIFDSAGNLGLQTTSPNYVLIAIAQHILEEVRCGALDGAWTKAIAWARTFGARIDEVHPGFRVIDRRDVHALSSDPGHLLIHIAAAGVSGFVLQDALAERGLDVEKATRDTILFLAAPHEADDVEAHLEIMRLALEDARAAGDAMSTFGLAVPAPPSVAPLTPREAAMQPSREVALEDSVGEIAAQLVAVYPPGSAIFAPGERIEARHVDYLLAVLEHGGRIRGLNPQTRTIRVVFYSF